MTLWECTGTSTEEHGEHAVRHRSYTTSKRTADLFARIPRIDFTDSGHGVVFHARVVGYNERPRRKPTRHMDYVDDQLRRLRKEAPPPREWVIDVCNTCGRIAHYPFCEHRPDRMRDGGPSWCGPVRVREVR